MDEEGARLRTRYLARRDTCARPGEPRAFVDAYSNPLPDLGPYLRGLERVSINAEFNGALCRSLLAARFRNDGEPDLLDFARKALGRGVAQLARAVRGTLGPRGMNAIIDRPVGTPIISRYEVSIASEVELEDPFENMDAQVVREASMRTNEVVGDGTTTSTVLADAMVQQGLAALDAGANPVELVAGLEQAVEQAITALRASAKLITTRNELQAVAVIAANYAATGALVAEALERAGPSGIVNVEYGTTAETLLEVVDGLALDRGYLSHHMVTDVERMQAVLDDPFILLTDQKLMTQQEVAAILRVIAGQSRPLLIIAEEVAPACVITLLGSQEKDGPRVAAIHSPDYGHWRKAMLDDIAIMTGGRVIARDVGDRIEDVSLRDLGSARQVRISSNQTIMSAGAGDPTAIDARREQVRRQIELAPPNIERDKLQERLARLAGGAAMILAGGATPVEQKRHAQLIEDAINAARAAAQDRCPARCCVRCHTHPDHPDVDCEETRAC